MAAVLSQLSWPFSRKGELCRPFVPADSRIPELGAAKEILAEVFAIDIEEVEEMIRRRCEEDVGSEDRQLWPDRLWVTEEPR